MPSSHLTSVELFTGAGGLALGVLAAGFEHRLLLEFNRHACETLKANRETYGPRCEIHAGDVRGYDFHHLAGVDLLAAGAPCQPFSIGGKHRAHADERNLFPQVFRAQREMRPRAVIVENVRGLLRPNLATFVEFIELQLAHPDILPADPLDPEGWEAHLPALREAAVANRATPTGGRYVVSKALLNAADYGVPQRRERVFFVALRADLGIEWTPPAPTHGRHGGLWCGEALRPWTTVREALAGLPKPVPGKEAPGFPNHVGQPGAKSYPGHTGSPLDAPAKTLKAGVHGVPGGENMLRNPNGTVRYFTAREAARLQTFPDNYLFRGAWTETMRQIGNAVPVALAAAVAGSVRACLERATETALGQQTIPAAPAPAERRPHSRRALRTPAPRQTAHSGAAG